MTYSLKELCIKTYNLINKINMHLTPGITRGKKNYYNETLPTVSKESQAKSSVCYV